MMLPLDTSFFQVEWYFKQSVTVVKRYRLCHVEQRPRSQRLFLRRLQPQTMNNREIVGILVVENRQGSVPFRAISSYASSKL